MSTTVCLSFDFDAVSGWINTFKQTSPTPISRGEYGARVGIQRILRVLSENDVPATFFVPGHTADLYPEAVRAIVEQHHELGGHGYLHESPVGLSRDEEEALLEKAERALEKFTKTRPIGYRSPAWDLSPHTIELLSERGYFYDSSLMSDDFRLFRARTGDQIGADGSVAWGNTSDVIEFPVAWELDDFPYFTFLPKPLYAGLRRPNEVFECWLGEFEYCHSHVDSGVFTLTMHPEITGRGPRILMLDRLIREIKQRPGVSFISMGEVAKKERAPHAAKNLGSWV
jgi:peptidoglycan/xylan/chitin deacetylase (PgdA/CDA1 family)